LNRPLLIFISSTKRDLQPERNAVIQALQKKQDEFQTVAMEFWVSSDQEPRLESLAKLRQSNIYVGIIGFFYCEKLDPQTRKSVTQLEYEHAAKWGIPRLVFLKSEESLVKPSNVEQEPTKLKKLEAFKLQIKADLFESTFTTPDELATSVAIALDKLVEKLREPDSAFDVYEGTELSELRNSLRFNPLAPDIPIPRKSVKLPRGRKRILIEGLAGSGKTTLAMLLCSSLKPSRVIVIKSYALLQMQKERLAGILSKPGKTIVLWDDIDKAYEYNQEDSVPSTIGMCEEIKKSGVITIVTCRSGMTSQLEGYPDGVFWRRFATLSLKRMTPSECRLIIGQFSKRFDVSVPRAIIGKLVRRILNAEGTPLYAVSLLRENSHRTLKLPVRIPSTVQKMWDEAAKVELIPTEVQLLCILRFLRRKGLMPFSDLVKALYTEMSARKVEAFHNTLSELEKKGWISSRSGLLTSLDTQLESVNCKPNPAPHAILNAIESNGMSERAAYLSLLGFGYAFANDHDDRAALMFFKQAMKLRPNDAQATANFAIILMNVGKFEEALVAVEKILKSNPSSALLWAVKAEILNELYKWREALSAGEKATRLSPSLPRAWQNKGMALLGLNLHKEALVALKKATKLDSVNAFAWFRYGEVLGRLGRLNEALAAYERTTDLRPDFVHAWTERGAILNSLGRHKESLSVLEQAIRLGHDPFAWLEKAHALQHLGRRKEQSASLANLRKFKAETAHEWLAKGTCLLRLNEPKAALAVLRKAAQLAPNNPTIWHWQAEAFLLLNRHEDELAASEKLVKLMPRLTYAWTHKAMALNALHRYEEALTAVGKAIALNPFSSPAWALRSALLGKIGRHQEAIVAERKARKLAEREARRLTSRAS
jgi:tetratricopeptide (TPR) repeat protein